MKILFVMTHAGFARNFEVPLRTLAERGHEVEVVLERGDPSLPDLRDRMLAGLLLEYPTLSVCRAPQRPPASWAATGRVLRTALDYGRYLEPDYAIASKPRLRAADRAPAGRVLLAFSRIGPRLLASIGEAERALPLSSEVFGFIRARRPDVVVVTPLVELGSPQLDYVRAARRLGITSVLAVASWDNLTMKGGIHEAPDLVAVWNVDQRREAIELHGVAPERIAVTGAVAYDHWLGWKPASSRAEFCRRVGLDPERPYILYVGSSSFIAPDEGDFLGDWVSFLRGDPNLARAAILYRPHPTNAFDLRSRGTPPDLVVHPAGGVDPQDEHSRSVYFDSIHHSAAVVGINTSALLEATLADRPVLTIVTHYREGQLGTIHFRYLLPERGGPVRAASSLAEHARQLGEALDAGPRGPAVADRAFVERFLRPRGASVPATPDLVDALERAAGRPPPTTSSRPQPRPPPGARAIAHSTRAALAVRSALDTLRG